MAGEANRVSMSQGRGYTGLTDGGNEHRAIATLRLGRLTPWPPATIESRPGPAYMSLMLLLVSVVYELLLLLYFLLKLCG